MLYKSLNLKNNDMKTLCTLLLLLSINFTMKAQYHNGPSAEEQLEMRRQAEEAGDEAAKKSFFYYFFRNKLIFLLIGGAVIGGGSLLFHKGDESENENF